MELPEINKRVRQLIDYYSGGNVKKFAESLPGVSQQRLNRLFNLDVRTQKYPLVTTDILVAITKMFVDVSPEWLLSGEGEVFRSGEVKEPGRAENGIASFLQEGQPRVITVDTSDADVIPIVDIAVAAGAGSYNPDHIDGEDVLKLPSWMLGEGYHLCVRIEGHSMAPALQDGGYVVTRLLERSEWGSVRDGGVYVITDSEGKSYIKRVKNRLKEAGVIICTSDNPDKAMYPDFSLEYSARRQEIANIWQVEWYLSDRMPDVWEAYSYKIQEMEENIDAIRQEIRLLSQKIR